MNQHRKRINRLSDEMDFHLAPGDDDEIVVIRLTWPEQEPVKPVTLRGGKNAGGDISVRWPQDAAEVEA